MSQRLKASVTVTVILAGTINLTELHAQNDQKGGNLGNTSNAAIVFRDLIKNLANKNSAPQVVGSPPDMAALFPPDYDWTEQDRILKSINLLCQHVQDAWLDLANHLDDKEYCITFDHGDDVLNSSVGSVCDIILSESLVGAYMSCLPKDKVIQSQLRNPTVIDYDNFRAWCFHQQAIGKNFKQLQIELCEWAAKRMTELEQVPEMEKRESIAAIRRRISDLEKSGEPFLLHNIRRESRVPYSKERAERVRIQLQK